jgi:hypothetical protein
MQPISGSEQYLYKIGHYTITPIETGDAKGNNQNTKRTYPNILNSALAGLRFNLT